MKPLPIQIVSPSHFILLQRLCKTHFIPTDLDSKSKKKHNFPLYIHKITL